ncbi:TetR/AcrR family transcriptional regulator [Pseudomonas putida]|uniref:TetR/AcrR family transcriptional regulator n=1 Tax=Pseudomonas putida TaxID=303 RepID=UPI00335C32EE
MGSIASSLATNANIESGSCKSLVVRRAALELFVTRGFQSVSLRQLADAVGIQAGSLYNHIESKQTLLFDFIEELDSLLLHAVSKSRRGRSCVRESLCSFIKTYMQLALENRDLYVLSRREVCNLSADQQSDISRIRTKVLESLADIVSLGCRKGVFDCNDANMTATTIIATLDGALSLPWSSVVSSNDLTVQVQGFIIQAITKK